MSAALASICTTVAAATRWLSVSSARPPSSDLFPQDAQHTTRHIIILTSILHTLQSYDRSSPLLTTRRWRTWRRDFEASNLPVPFRLVATHRRFRSQSGRARSYRTDALGRTTNILLRGITGMGRCSPAGAAQSSQNHSASICDVAILLSQASNNDQWLRRGNGP